VIVLVLRPGGGTPVAFTSAPDGATADPSGLGEAGLPSASDSPSPSPSASPSTSQSATAKPSPSASATPPGARDDFTAATLDKTKWNIYTGTSFSADMVRVQGGELQVLGVGRNATATANKAGGLCWCGNGNYTYGTWQVRARFDAGAGYGVVVMLWPGSNNGTTDGYVDFAQDNDAARKTVGVVLNPPGGGTAGKASRTGDFTAWHVYRIDWRATYIRVYLDGALIYDSSTDAAKPAVPNKPLHLVLQVNKGPSGSIPAATAQTPAEVVTHVDWVSYAP
jgi:hypothetical protein